MRSTHTDTSMSRRGQIAPPRPSVRPGSLDAPAIAEGALKQPVVTVQRRHAIRFGHRRVVERCIDEIQQRIGLPFLRHDRLANVDDLRRVRAEAGGRPGICSVSR